MRMSENRTTEIRRSQGPGVYIIRRVRSSKKVQCLLMHSSLDYIMWWNDINISQFLTTYMQLESEIFLK